MMSIRFLWMVLAVLLPCLVIGPAYGTITQTASGFITEGDPVSSKAELTISGDTLTIVLTNTSAATLRPAALLSSYYFDIKKPDDTRPVLTYVSATGDVYLTDKDAPDSLQTANADLKAVAADDDTWQFKTMDPTQTPFQGFGVGTVGNSSLSPNNFNGNIVDGFDFSIYVGDVTTQNLDGYPLVKDKVTFVFSGVTGFTEADINPVGVFGFGTEPDTLIPEPAGILLISLAGMSLLRRRRR